MLPAQCLLCIHISAESAFFPPTFFCVYLLIMVIIIICIYKNVPHRTTMISSHCSLNIDFNKVALFWFLYELVWGFETNYQIYFFKKGWLQIQNSLHNLVNCNSFINVNNQFKMYIYFLNQIFFFFYTLTLKVTLNPPCCYNAPVFAIKSRCWAQFRGKWLENGLFPF